MKLTGIGCLTPSNKISNEDVIELVKFYSSNRFKGKIVDLELVLRRLINSTGIKSRFWRNKNEKPIDLLKSAASIAVNMAGIKESEIDMVIYSSIDRGFIEPSNASFVCKLLNLKNIRCFDIVDACMGWCSALQTADSFLKSNPLINTVLVINSEFPMDEKGTVLPKNFTINDIKELAWKFPSLTLGEGVSVSVLQRDNNNNIRFEIIEKAENVDLCTISLINSDKYYETDKNINDLQFYADGARLLKMGMESSIGVLTGLLKKIDYVPKAIFPHAVSNKIIQDAAFKANVSDLIYSTFPELGNLATVSIPASIYKALLNKAIAKDDRAIGWIASAGMKFSAFEIQL